MPWWSFADGFAAIRDAAGIGGTTAEVGAPTSCGCAICVGRLYSMAGCETPAMARQLAQPCRMHGARLQWSVQRLGG